MFLFSSSGKWTKIADFRSESGGEGFFCAGEIGFYGGEADSG